MNKKLTKIVGITLGLSMAVGVGAGIATSNRQVNPVFATADSVSYGKVVFSAALPTDGNWTGVGGGPYCGGYGKNKSNAWSVTLDFDSATSINWAQVDFDETVSFSSTVKAAANGGEGDVVLSLDNASGDSISKDISNFGSGSNSASASESSMDIASVTGQFSHITLDFPSKTFITEFSCSLNYTIKAGGGPVTFTVSYSANGGSGTMVDGDSPYSSGSTVTILDNEFTRSGYVFDHWDTKADDSGTDYNEGDTFVISASTTLYAQWASAYTVSYDANGGTGTMTDSNSPYRVDTSVTVKDNAFTRTDYTFVRWNTKADGTGTYYDEGDTFTISSNTTLYAQWRITDLAGHNGTINFGNASGSLKVNATSVSGDDDLRVTWTVNTVPGSAGESFTQYASYSQIGASAKPAESITFESQNLQANYKVKAFSAKFGGFSGTAGDVTLKVGDTEVGTGSLNASEDVTVSKTITAVGSKLSVTVDNINKGVKAYFISYTLAPEIETQTLSYSVASAYDDEEITISSDAESAVTWSIVSGSGTTAAGAEITSGGVVSVDGPGTVTVKATAAGYSDATIQVTFIEKPANAHTVTFVSNGGSVSPAAKVIADQGTFEFPSAGTKTGYVFDGWTSTGSAPYHAVGETSPAVTDDITYTAHWTEVYEHTVYFGTADGTAGLSNFANTSYIIPSEVTLDNIQGNVYGKNDNTSSAIRLGKGDATGSFDVTIDSDYYIKKVIANLKYYNTDSAAEFAVSPNAEYSVKKAGLTNSFADYEFDVSEAFSNKVTFSNTITGKRVYISGFTLEYDIKPSSVAAIKAIDTVSVLRFNYTDSISNVESFSNTAIRFGGFISKALWDSLEADVDIKGYGILVAANSGLGGETIKQKYASAKTTSNTPEQAISALGAYGVMKNVQNKTNPSAADDGQKSFMNVSGDYYVWTVKKTIGSEFTAKYNAVAFILIDGGIVFLDEVSYSAKDIATRDVPNTDVADPALPALTWIKDH